jgi:DNA-directed RNA polymerase subunit alpha
VNVGRWLETSLCRIDGVVNDASSLAWPGAAQQGVRRSRSSRATRTPGSPIEPFERGFGTTVGNSLRRVLLSSLEGAAVTGVKIKGAEHEFTTLPGVYEDVTDIILNVKNLVVKLEGDEPKTMRSQRPVPGEVTADLIEARHRRHDPEQGPGHRDAHRPRSTSRWSCASARAAATCRRQRAVRRHRRAGDRRDSVDSIYSPVQRVRYKVEETRVGQKTNFDKLTLEIWTNGTTTPEMALVEAAKIFRKHLNPFVQYFERAKQRVSEEAAAAASVDEELIRKLNMPHRRSWTSRSGRATAWSRPGSTPWRAGTADEADLLKVRSFGKTSLREVKRKLQDLGLSLGMPLPEGYQVGAGSAL